MSKSINDAKLSIHDAEAVLTPSKGGKYVCPACGGKNLTLSTGDDGKLLVNCFAPECRKGAAYNALKERVRGSGATAVPRRREPPEGNDIEKRARKAKRILKAACKADFWPDKYLEGRGIREVPDNTYLLPAKHARVLKLPCSNFPRMVLPVVNKAGEETGCHTIILSKNADKKLKRTDPEAPVKYSYGLIAGSFIEIGHADPEKPLLVAEGYETAASVAQITGYSAIATCGINFFQKVDLPDCSEVILCPDNEPTAIEAARAKARTLTVPARIAVPNGPPKYDWNDALLDGTPEKTLREAILKAPVFEEDEDDEEPDHQGAKQVDVLIALAADAELFHDEDRGYAIIKANGHRETWPINSKAFKDWLLHRFYKQQGTAPSGEALRTAIATIAARAKYDGPQRTVFIRVGDHDEKIYLDLCDDEWRVVEIDGSGWRLVENPPVCFTRANGMLPLPVPVGGGSVDDLREFVNVRKDKQQTNRALDSDFVLLVAVLLAQFRPQGPYPILAVMGEEGSAKTTLTEIMRELVDPSKVRERRLPREERDLFIATRKGHVMPFGNVSQIPDWLSDALCNLATGGGYAARTLYTDEDETLFTACRPVMLNGIEFSTRSDLADRSIFLRLPRITDRGRRVEQQIRSEFKRKQSGILGALLDVVSHGLKCLPNTPIAPEQPRMADFAHWIAACEDAMWGPGTFSDAYSANRKSATLDVIEGEAVATSILQMKEMEKDGGSWKGTASKLLDRLELIVGEKETRRKHWPGSASALSNRLQRAAPRLRKLGVKIIRSRSGQQGTRTLTLKRTKPAS